MRSDLGARAIKGKVLEPLVCRKANPKLSITILAEFDGQLRDPEFHPRTANISS